MITVSPAFDNGQTLNFSISLTLLIQIVSFYPGIIQAKY